MTDLIDIVWPDETLADTVNIVPTSDLSIVAALAEPAVEFIAVGLPGPGAPPPGTPDNYIAASIGEVTVWVDPGSVHIYSGGLVT